MPDKIKSTFTAESMLAAALTKARGDVAQACLENRGALDRAVARCRSDDELDDVIDLREILAALDRWHDASAVLMQYARKPTIPPGFEIADPEPQ